jgi:hypothetical protein
MILLYAFSMNNASRYSLKFSVRLCSIYSVLMDRNLSGCGFFLWLWFFDAWLMIEWQKKANLDWAI